MNWTLCFQEMGERLQTFLLREMGNATYPLSKSTCLEWWWPETCTNFSSYMHIILIYGWLFCSLYSLHCEHPDHLTVSSVILMLLLLVFCEKGLSYSQGWFHIHYVAPYLPASKCWDDRHLSWDAAILILERYDYVKTQVKNSTPEVMWEVTVKDEGY